MPTKVPEIGLILVGRRRIQRSIVVRRYSSGGQRTLAR